MINWITIFLFIGGIVSLIIGIITSNLITIIGGFLLCIIVFIDERTFKRKGKK